MYKSTVKQTQQNTQSHDVNIHMYIHRKIMSETRESDSLCLNIYYTYIYMKHLDRKKSARDG